MSDHLDRSALLAAADSIAPLNIEGCHALARHLDSLAHATTIDPIRVRQAATLAADVRARLRADTDPNRWISEFDDQDINYDLIAALVSERRAQAERVSTALECLMALTPVAV